MLVSCLSWAICYTPGCIWLEYNIRKYYSGIVYMYIRSVTSTIQVPHNSFWLIAFNAFVQSNAEDRVTQTNSNVIYVFALTRPCMTPNWLWHPQLIQWNYQEYFRCVHIVWNRYWNQGAKTINTKRPKQGIEINRIVWLHVACGKLKVGAWSQQRPVPHELVLFGAYVIATLIIFFDSVHDLTTPLDTYTLKAVCCYGCGYGQGSNSIGLMKQIIESLILT